MKFYNERPYGSGVESSSLFCDGLVDACVVARHRQACAVVGGGGAVNPLQLSNNVLYSFVASTNTSFVGFEIKR